jgi:hypothetical protein
LKRFPTLFESFAPLVALSLFAVSVAADSRHAATSPIYDVVAVGRRSGEIVLSTPALGKGEHWRFRRIAVEPKDTLVKSAILSRSGTQLKVEYVGGHVRVYDLTVPLKTISDAAAPRLAHHLPEGDFPIEAINTCFVRNESDDLAACARAIQVEISGDAPTADAPANSGDGVLAANLVKESRGNYQWSFFRVRPEMALYAPVLELAPGESVYPSDVKIWDTLNPSAKAATREEFQAAYDTLGAQRISHCNIYYRSMSYPGSWLLEYWYYYPFDEGKPHRHVHDSEHVFIEVDKLGGAVRSYIASDHGSFAANNGYSTFLPGAQPISLPLFAMVELDKHSMAPDINRDAEFTRGVDENLHPENYGTWGVRDVATQPQHLMKPYRPSMTLARKPEDRLFLREAPQYFPELQVSKGHDACGLISLSPEASGPDEKPSPGAAAAAGGVSCKDCVTATAQTAMHYLLKHPDAQHPTAIYKPWVLPYREVRLGMAVFDHNGNHNQLYGAYVFDLRHLSRGALPIPGRIAFEGMWSPASRPGTLTAAGHTRTGTISSEMYAGVRYESFYSHTQGYYFGVTPQLRRFTTNTLDGVTVPPSTEWQYNGVWYRVGYMFVLPSRIHGNMTHHVGVMFNGSLVRFEWRISFGMLRQRGRNHFGISPSQ